MSKEAKQNVFMEVGTELVQATRGGVAAAAGAATTIALLLQRRAMPGVPIDIGDEDALPALHEALGSALTAVRDLNRARLAGFGLAKAHGFLGDDIGAMCPCGEGPPPSGELSLVALPTRAKAA